MSKIAIKSFIDGLEKFNLNIEEETYSLSNNSYNKLKILSKRVNNLLENFETKGFLFSKEYKELNYIFSDCKTLEELNNKTNGNTR